jgi:hypothetical protein
MDAYQAVFDATKVSLRNCEVGNAVENVLRSEGIGFHAQQAFTQMGYDFADLIKRPSVILRPRISQDGDSFVCLYGENLQEGIAGFGKSPEEACADFDRVWATKIQ